MTGDMQLTCSDCGQEFTFTADDQAFFRDRGYSTPKRCKPCRQAKKNASPGGGGGGFRSSGGGGGYSRGGGGGNSQETTVTCAGCGQQTTVPFQPRGDRPVFCRDCYQAQSGGQSRRSNRY